MQHLDEGTIHALLDGELAGAEGSEVLAHIESCEVCSSRVAEERLIQSEAERMILELDEPVVRPAATAPSASSAPPFVADEPFVLPPPPPEQLVRQGPPIVLVPDRDADRPRLPFRHLAAAAMLIVAAGAGYLAFAERNRVRAAPRAPEVFSDAPVTITLPPLGAAEGDSSTAGAFALDSGAGAAARDTTGRDTARAALARADAADSAASIQLADSPTAAKARSEDRATQRAAAPPPEREQTVAERREEQRVARDEADRPAAEPTASRQAVTGAEAAAPTASVAAPPVSPAQRRAMALDQEAQITMRVGLDEAQRMLGGPVHVIDGMRPEFMGLVEGRLVPGADPNAYVVRVVYLDDNRRMVFLDQQRLDQSRRLSGAARDTTPPDWVKGDVRLSVKGALSAEELRALAGRVR